MRGLLRKDIYMFSNFTLLVTALWTATALVLNDGMLNMGMWFLIFLSLSIPMSMIALDEQYRWDRLVSMMPVRPRDVVLGKYLLAWGQLLLAFSLGLLGSWCWGLWSGAELLPELRRLGMTAALVLLLEAYMFPATYRLGRRRASTVMMIPMAAVLGFLLWDMRELAALEINWLAWPSVLLLALALNLASIPLSIRFYARRQRGWYQ